MEGDMINGLPLYIIEGSPEAELYRYHHSWQSHEFEAEEEEGTGANGAHYAANIGDLDTLIHIMKNERAEMLYEHDNNGWLPIHEVSCSFASFTMNSLFCIYTICTLQRM